MNHKENYLRQFHRKRREDQEELDKKWTKTDDPDKLIKLFNAQKSGIKPEDLPF